MATQKQVLSYTSPVLTAAYQSDTIYTCPAGKIAKIQFKFANFFDPDDNKIYNQVAQLNVKPSGSAIKRPFAYLTGASTSNGSGYTMYPGSAEKAMVHYTGTSTTYQYLFQANPAEGNLATPQSVNNLILFPPEVYLNSGDALIVGLDGSHDYNYTFYLNGLILIEDSDA